jgi:pimeloyl-ACP methyl ester carboxylesterase
MPASRRQYRRSTEVILGQGVLDRWPGELAEVGYLSARRPGFASSVASFLTCLATPMGVRKQVTIPLGDLAQITVLVLLIWGDKDVFLSPARAAEQIGAIPNATLVTISGGHAPWLDEPDQSGVTLADFLTAALSQETPS